MMRIFSQQIVSFVAATVTVTGCLAAYVRSETSPAQTLTTQGVITPRTRAIISGEKAYVLGPSEYVASLARVDKVAVSSDGGAILIAGIKARPYRGVSLSSGDADAQVEQRFPEMNLVCWDTRTRTAQTLLRESLGAEKKAALIDMRWFAQSRTALVALARESGGEITGTLLRVDAATGTVTRLAGLTVEQSLGFSPRVPLAFVYTDPTKGENGQPDTPPSIRVYTPQGSRPPFRLSEGVNGWDWAPDGTSIYAVKTTAETVDGKRKLLLSYRRIDLATGKETLMDKPPAKADIASAVSEPNDWLVDCATTDIAVPDSAGKTQSVPGLWLRATNIPPAPLRNAPGPALLAPTVATNTAGAKPALQVASGVATGSLLIATNAEPTGFLHGQSSAAVLFSREGALFAAPVFRMSVDEFTRSLRQVQRTATMTNAKQIGLGLLMYSQDYDDVFPQPGSAVSESVMPYLRSKSAFENPANGEFGFTYALKGDPTLTKMEAVANTQLGYLSGEGGRAIIWVDGHVTWEDGPGN